MSEAPRIEIEELLAEREWLRRLARRLVGDATAAEDLTQDAFVRALERGGPDGRGSRSTIRGWLSTVVRRLAVERGRSEARRREREEAVAPFEGGDRDALGRAALQRDMVEALLRLDEPERSAVTLRYLERLSYAEVALRQGTSEPACRKRVSRGIARLREQLDRQDDERSRGLSGGWLAIAGAWADPKSLTNTGGAEALAETAAASDVSTFAGRWLGMKTTTKGLLAALVLLLGSAGFYGLLSSLEAAPQSIALGPGESEGSGPAEAAALAQLEAESQLVRVPSEEPAGLKPMVSAIPAFPDRPAAITGTLVLRIRWSDGTPAAGATAKLLPWGDPTPKARARRVVTGPDGEVRVERLAAGRVGVYTGRSQTLGHRPEVLPGRVTLEEIELPVGFEVKGRVLSPEGAPVPYADIVLSDYGNLAAKVVARTDGRGAFLLRDVGDGRSISARAAGYAPSALVRLSGIAPGASHQLDLRLFAGAGVLHGTVEDESGTPLRGALVKVSAAPLQGGQQSRHPMYLESGEDGSFIVTSMGAGGIGVTVTTEAHVPVSEGVRLQADGGVTEKVFLMQEGARLIGQILRADGAPAAGAVVIASQRWSYGSARTVKTNDAGNYELLGLPGGRLDLRAREDDHGESVGERLLRAGETGEWNAQLVAGRTLRGQVVDERGEPLAGWMVGTQTGPAVWDRRCSTEADGTFTLADVREDAVELHVTVPNGWRAGTLVTQGLSGDSGAMEIVVPDRVRPSSSLRLRVLAGGSAPDPAAMVWIETAGAGFRKAFSDVTGEVQVSRLRPGPGSLSISAEGWETLEREFELTPGGVLDLGVIELSVEASDGD